MNFDTWFKSHYGESNDYAKSCARNAWLTFKRRMNSILDDPKSWEYTDNENECLTEKALEKLRNL